MRLTNAVLPQPTAKFIPPSRWRHSPPANSAMPTRDDPGVLSDDDHLRPSKVVHSSTRSQQHHGSWPWCKPPKTCVPTTSPSQVVILLTISQQGRLSQWIQVPLSASSASIVEMTLPSLGNDLLPSTHLTPTTLLGGGGGDRETIGQLYAAQIASHLSLRSPDDRRILVLGLGLVKPDKERETFFDLFELARKVL
ncbi:hypothetical protein XA68_12566 [Ophiocordyceps unilateralis]|uniref:Proteasome assembly chaperone 3 n=1 Tax=Ophiocordyceps unilateralis TaxID=268505 RepID=A0A2A9PEH3_OPHUN|nr:hypothetical protein XA68_12566 [Ophiocordyceps unilateralis]